jgi:uncharacterized membrane protein
MRSSRVEEERVAFMQLLWLAAAAIIASAYLVYLDLMVFTSGNSLLQ